VSTLASRWLIKKGAIYSMIYRGFPVLTNKTQLHVRVWKSGHVNKVWCLEKKRREILTYCSTITGIWWCYRKVGRKTSKHLEKMVDCEQGKRGGG